MVKLLSHSTPYTVKPMETLQSHATPGPWSHAELHSAMKSMVAPRSHTTSWGQWSNSLVTLILYRDSLTRFFISGFLHQTSSPSGIVPHPTFFPHITNNYSRYSNSTLSVCDTAESKKILLYATQFFFVSASKIFGIIARPLLEWVRLPL